MEPNTQDFNLSTLNGTNGFTINGINVGDQSGISVSSAGDINGDGIDDLIIGAAFANNSSGQSYVVFGSQSAFSASLNLSELIGANGFAINGVNATDYSGASVSSAGDINGDGIDDLIIGAFQGDPGGVDNAGQSYVVFGSQSGFSASLDLSSLDGLNGFQINGINPGDNSGFSVSNAGDINGDGIDDLIIGARNANNYYGQSFVVFGSQSGFSTSLDLSSLDGSNGFQINGINQGDTSGFTVSSAGDINGDGIDDLIIGAPSVSFLTGQSYVVFGSQSVFSSSLNLSALDGSNGFAINGINIFESSGFSVSSAGDINGDGIDDLILGAPFANGYSGQSFVVFGHSSFNSSLDLFSLDGSNGFAINGINLGDNSGFSVSSAGDINGDGIDDLIIGARYANGSSGQSYVVFGRSAFNSSLDLSALDSINGFAINGINPGDNLGFSVSSAGDINGDGIDDLILGARNANNSSGQSYVVFGNTTLPINNPPLLAQSLSPQRIGEGQLFNFVIPSTTFKDVGDLVYSISNITPLPDGLSFDSNTRTLSGTPSGTTAGIYKLTIIATDAGGLSATTTLELTILNFIGTNNNDILTGTNNNETLTGLASDDILNGLNGDDILNGDQGNDILRGGAGADTLNGGEGNDNLYAGAGNDILEGGAGDDVYYISYYATEGSNDIIIETENGGTDTAYSVLTVDALANHVERLVLIGNASINATGNSLNNIIYGNGGDNLINGDTGNDILYGGAGSDILDGDAGNDILRDNLGNDSLIGGEGNDNLYAGAGNDTLEGGAGDDVYYISYYATEGSNDIIIETENGGTDTAYSVLTVDALANHVERLFLIGNASINATGSSLDNIIYGNSGDNSINGDAGNDILHGGAGNDLLNGDAGNDILRDNLGNDSLIGGESNDNLYAGAGNDTLEGGAGDDVYYISYYATEGSNDIIIETENGGTDTAYSILTVDALANHVERLVLIGNASINGTGNSLDNIIHGNGGDNSINGSAGNDILRDNLGDDSLIGAEGNDNLFAGVGNNTLEGGAGNDSLFGGMGNDFFQFSGETVLNLGVDRIFNFGIGVDKIILSKATFSALTTNAGDPIGNQFGIVANDALIGSANAAIVYSRASGDLFYNPNLSQPNLGTDGGRFADLDPNLAITTNNFIVID